MGQRVAVGGRRDRVGALCRLRRFARSSEENPRPAAGGSALGAAHGKMAWRSHGTSNATLVAHLKRNGLLGSEAVESALLAVDRGRFVPEGGAAYEDAPQYLGHGATISAPHMHAHCAELLAGHLVPGARALDVGSGSGYLACVFAEMVGPAGSVRGIEHVPELVARSRDSVGALARDRPGGAVAAMWRGGALVLEVGDGRADEVPGGPYDAVHVGAAAAAVPPGLVAALAPGGRMVIPVGPAGGPQVLRVLDKDAAGAVTSEDAMGVIYVPLTSRELQAGNE